MAKEIEINIPDIGGAQVDVIEVLVRVGDAIEIDSPLITLESDKASMEIPSPAAGTVTKISTKVGDKVSEGDLILIATVEAGDEPKAEAAKTEEIAKVNPSDVQVNIESTEAKPSQPQILEVSIPDIGGATDVDVIDILVQVGSAIEKDQSLITLEGDKATMDIPAPYAGIVKEIKVKIGEKVSQGKPILIVKTNCFDC